jgi:hypothetical protein
LIGECRVVIGAIGDGCARGNDGIFSRFVHVCLEDQVRLCFKALAVGNTAGGIVRVGMLLPT